MKEEYEEMSVLDTGENILDPDISILQPLKEGALDGKCRACIRRLPDVKYNLLETWELSERFTRLSTTQLDADDLLPKSICPECFQRLQDVDNFQKTCIASYTILLDYIANNLKEDSSEAGALPIDPIEDSASNRSKLLEFEEVVVSDIKSEDIKSEDQLDSEESETEKAVAANQKKSLSGEIYPSLKKTKVRQSSRRRQTKMKKSSDEKEVENEDESTPRQTALYTCEKCGTKFDSEIHYKAHLRMKEGKKPYPCQQCTREYVSINLLEKHIHIEHSANLPPKYECTVDGCDKKFRSQHALTNHQLKSHSNVLLPKERRRVICETCGKFLSGGTIREHEMMHKGLAPYSCDQCPKKFPSSIRLEKHKLTHLNIKQHSCPICGIKMRSKNDIDGHMNVHTRKKKFLCDHCEAAFSTKANLQRHVRTVHYRIKEFVCTYCEESFGQSITLQRHLMLHTGEKPHKCPYCGKGFVQKSKMKDHCRIHEENGDRLPENIPTVDENTSTGVEEGFKNFECEICGLKTTYKELKRHMTAHKREKKYTCEICNTTFKEERSLENHIKIVHDGIKLFPCEYCDKSFGAASTLRNHTMTHTGERPFHCPHCEKRFITRFALQYHEKKREKDIAKGKIPCSKTGPGTEIKAKRKRKRKSSSKIMILATTNSQTDIPQTDMPQTDMRQTDRSQTTSYNQDETMLV